MSTFNASQTCPVWPRKEIDVSYMDLHAGVFENVHISGTLIQL